MWPALHFQYGTHSSQLYTHLKTHPTWLTITISMLRNALAANNEDAVNGSSFDIVFLLATKSELNETVGEVPVKLTVLQRTFYRKPFVHDQNGRSHCQ